MKIQYGKYIMDNIENNELRQTQIVDEEIVDSKRDEIKDELFNSLKDSFIAEQRLLGRFLEFSTEHGCFEYDELGVNDEEGEEILRKANKLRDKLLSNIEQEKMFVFENVDTNSLTNMISFNVEESGERFRVVVEVLEDSFNLEIM
jgi:hypothetical protein